MANGYPATASLKNWFFNHFAKFRMVLEFRSWSWLKKLELNWTWKNKKGTPYRTPYNKRTEVYLGPCPGPNQKTRSETDTGTQPLDSSSQQRRHSPCVSIWHRGPFRCRVNCSSLFIMRAVRVLPLARSRVWPHSLNENETFNTSIGKNNRSCYVMLILQFCINSTSP